MSSTRLVIHQGELSDMPGRSEQWIELLSPLDGDRWVVEVEGTTFSGTGDAEPMEEIFECAEDLADWLASSDAEDGGDRVSIVLDYAISIGNSRLANLLRRH